MASIRQSIRSSTTSKRPTSAIADGQIALNTASGEPGLFFKDNANNIIKTGPAHYGASAPNVSPAVGGSAGNSLGEAWLDSALTPPGWKIWSGTAWVNATPLSSDTVQGLVELATNAETQAGVDTARAVTSASLQSKVSDSISTASASGIASSTAVKTAYDLANAALPKSGGIITGNLEISSTGSFTFEGSTADGFETTLAVVDPTVDRTITFPNITGTVVTTGDSGTVTSTMIADGTIVNADVSTSAAIAFSKLASLASANILVGNASGVATSTVVSGDVTITNAGVTSITSNVIVNADINSAAAIAYSKLALSSGITNTDISASAAVAYSKLALSNSIVNADINSAAAIAGTKISPDFGSQNLTTTGNITAANHITASGTATSAGVQVGTGATYKPGIYSPGADQLAISTSGTGRLFVDGSGRVGVGGASAGPLFLVNGTPSTSTTANLLSVRNGSAANANNIAQVDFWCANSFGGNEAVAAIRALNPNASGNNGGALVFATSLYGTATTPSERIRITNDGLVGIGDSAPASKLTVADSSALTTTGISSCVGISLQNTSNTIGNYTSIQNKDASGDQNAEIKFFNITQDTTLRGAIAFTTRSATGEFAEKMRLSPEGRLGIGTASPSSALHVVGSTSAFGNGNASLFWGDTSAVGGLTYSGTTAIVQASSGSAALAFYRGSTETGRFDSSSRFLVGTSSSPSAGNGQYALTAIQGNTATSSGEAFISLQRGQAATAITSGVGIGQVNFGDSSGNSFATIQCLADAAAGAGDYPGRLVFSTTADGAASPTERMRITNAGSILSFAASANDAITAGVASGAGATPYLFAGVHSRTGTATGGTLSYSVAANGNVQNTNGSYTTISDAKLKENIVDAGSQWDDFKVIRICNWNFKAETGHQTHRQIGPIANELEAVCPGLVFETPDRDQDGNETGEVTKGVNQSVLYMKAVKALQEAMERIETLEASNADMLARLTALEAA